MTEILKATYSRRRMMAGLASGVAAGTLAAAAPARAQPAPPSQSQQANPPTQPVPRFGFDDVVRRARELASAAFEPPAPLPDVLQRLDFDAWRDIRFRPDRALLDMPGSNFRLQTFHLGFLYRRPGDGQHHPRRHRHADPLCGEPVRLRPHEVRQAAAREPRLRGLPAALSAQRPARLRRGHRLPWRSSYFRFLGRNQHYGLSARGITVNAGTDREEFPFFREFWVDMSDAQSDRATIYGLLDSDSLTGAYRFDLYPSIDSALEVSVVLFPRKSGIKLGLAPLTSMFFSGENDRRIQGDYRPELHDSDGLLMHLGTGEWLWRPLRNPARPEISTFLDKDVRGFGLLQRDRTFEHYQDLDLAYEARPSYWVEPRGGWGDGQVELVELPTADETNDNIVLGWTPRDAVETGKQIAFGYRITASLDLRGLSPNGRVANTYQTEARALGSSEPLTPGTHRFIVDFSGGDLPYYLLNPPNVEVVASTSAGRILRSYIVPNGHIGGFRAALDVALDPGQGTDLRAFLRAGNKTLTETWTFPWKAPQG